MSGLETVKCDFCGHNEAEFIVSQTDRIHKTTEELFSVVRYQMILAKRSRRG